jgi:uncharacterized protein YbjT (DUF2867 family)
VTNSNTFFSSLGIQQKMTKINTIPMIWLIAILSQFLLMLSLEFTNAFTTIQDNRRHFLQPDHIMELMPRTIRINNPHNNNKDITNPPRRQFQNICQRMTSTTRLDSASLSSSASGITSGDTVLVIGGTGGVGQLVSQKLACGQYGNIQIRVTSRNQESASKLFESNDAIQVVQLDLVGMTSTDLANQQQQLKNEMEGVSAVVISVGTTAFPTKRWWGGNTPDAIDNIAVTNIVSIASNIPSIQKIILVTSIGVTRTDVMPFKILNLFGVLDAKRAGEVALQQCGKNYVIIRPGRLIGGPFTNLDVARLLQIQGGTENGVTIEAGDTLLGDCKRDACSEAIVQCLVTSEPCSGIEFSIISNPDIPSLTANDWKNEFDKLTSQSADVAPTMPYFVN